MRLSLLLSLLIFFTGCEQGGDSATTEFVIDTSLPLEERIVLVDLEGNKTDLSTYRGKTVFLNFWATWCKPCIKEMPSIDQARISLENQDVVFIAASDEKIEKIKKFAVNSDYGFQIVQVQGDIFDLDIKALPTTFIINPDGKIVYNEVGAREWHEEANIELITSQIQ